jgi:hypothetical protein
MEQQLPPGARSGDDSAEVGPGIIGRAAATLYWFVMIELLLVLTAGPTLAVLVLLDQDASNAPIAALLFVPLAPALSAAIFAWRVFLDDRDLAPAKHFWRGYRLNALDVLRWWVPAVFFLGILGFTLGNLNRVTLPAGYPMALLVLAAAVLLWAAQALVLSSTLSLRTRDTARLAAYYLAAKPLATLGVLSLLIFSGGVVFLTSDWVLVALAAPLTLLLLRNADPVLRDATERFTA